jgi:large subunit ribosomal protein L30
LQPREASKNSAKVLTVGKMIKIKMVKSEIGRPEKQRKILRGMGLNKMNSTVTLVDTPEVRGMINKVIHLVSVEESKE